MSVIEKSKTSNLVNSPYQYLFSLFPSRDFVSSSVVSIPDAAYFVNDNGSIDFVQESIEQAYKIGNRYFGKEELLAAPEGQEIKIYANLNQPIDKFSVNFNFVFIDPLFFVVLLSPTSPVLNSFLSYRSRFITFKGIDLVGVKFPNLQIFEARDSKFTFFNSDTELLNVSFLNYFPKQTLRFLGLKGCNLSGLLNLRNFPLLINIDLSNNNFSTSNLDFLVRNLYLGGMRFGFGKSLRIEGQSTQELASGSIGDPVSANNGQGYITGLINDYGWTVIQ